MALFLVWCCLIDVECPPSENLHFLSGRERKSLCQVRCSMSLYPLHLHLFESPDPFFWICISPISGAKPLQ